MKAVRIVALCLPALWACASTGHAEPATPPLPPPRPPLAQPETPGVGTPPVPPARPPDLLGAIKSFFGPPMPPRPTPAPTSDQGPASAGVPIDEELVCVRLFNGGHVEARAIAAMPPTANGCGIAAPVEVAAIVADGKRRIPLQPPVQVNCAMAEALANWVRDDLVPSFAATSNTLVGLRSTSGYACRGRNNVAGAKTSEHGRGNAVDIGGFDVAGGGTITVKQAGTTVLPAVRATACGRFATVLGPGSDGFHETHMHVDLETRRHGSKICHWDMP